MYCGKDGEEYWCVVCVLRPVKAITTVDDVVIIDTVVVTMANVTNDETSMVFTDEGPHIECVSPRREYFFHVIIVIVVAAALSLPHRSISQLRIGVWLMVAFDAKLKARILHVTVSPSVSVVNFCSDVIIGSY